MSSKQQEIDACNLVSEFIKTELEEFSIYDELEITDCDSHMDTIGVGVELKLSGKLVNMMNFEVRIKPGAIGCITFNNANLHVNIGPEDHYEEIRDYDPSIKYFWIALLGWPEGV